MKPGSGAPAIGMALETLMETPLETTLSGDFQSLRYVKPFGHDDGAAKSLHFTLGELQSRMFTHRPWRLEVD